MAYCSTAEEGIVWTIDNDGDVFILDSGSISIWVPVDNSEFDWVLAPDAEL